MIINTLLNIVLSLVRSINKHNSIEHKKNSPKSVHSMTRAKQRSALQVSLRFWMSRQYCRPGCCRAQCGTSQPETAFSAFQRSWKTAHRRADLASSWQSCCGYADYLTSQWKERAKPLVSSG